MEVRDTVLPGELLGPVVGLAFSKDGGLLFACAGSSVRVFEVASGRSLLSRRVLEPGVSVSGIDVVNNQCSVGAVFGDRYVRVVDGVPTAEDVPRSLCSSHATPSLGKTRLLSSTDGQHAVGRGDAAHLKVAVSPATEGKATTRSRLIPRSSWFRTVARLPELADRVWDARLIGGGEFSGGKGGQWNREERDREKMAGGKDEPAGLVAVAFAHNFVEVWNWTAKGGPEKLWRSCKGDVCLLYHARLWGRTLAELRVASGTVYNQVLVWKPSDARAGERGGETQGEVPVSVGLGKAIPEWNRNEGDGEEGAQGRQEVLRLKGHEGVIFRVTWREDGKRVASVSDDRTVRVWGVESRDGPPYPVAARDDKVVGVRSSSSNLRDGGLEALEELEEFEEPWRLLWTGWGHSSRVWDVAFCGRGLVSAGEDGTAILWDEDAPPRDRERSSVEGFVTVGAQVSADASPSVGSFSRHSTGERESRQRTPGAIMRGHRGSPVWRVAVYESHPHAGVHRRGGGVASVVEGDAQGLELLATGGNDGAIKLWDLAFESACRKGQSTAQGAFWRETDALPGSKDSDTLGVLKPHDVVTMTSSAVGVGSRCSGSGNLEQMPGTGTLHSAPTSSKNALSASLASNDLNQWPRPEYSGRGALGCETASSGHIASVSGTAHAGAARVGRSIRGGRCKVDEERRSGKEERRGQGRKRQRSTLVREVRLSHDGTGAAMLFADGRVLWVENLASGSWEQVTVEAENDDGDGGGDGARSDFGVGCDRKILMLPSDGISAIAVSRSTAKGIFSKGEGTESTFEDARDRRVQPGEADSCYDCGRPRVFRDVIVAGRDDGALFLLARARGYPDPSEVCDAPDGIGREMPESWHRGEDAEPRAAWVVEMSWVGHRVKVTAVWPAGVGAVGECLPSGVVRRPLRAALDTSRLKAMPGREAGSIRLGAGALVSAAADGTLVWWNWTNEDGAGRCTPQMRMMCFAGTSAAIRSFVIDEEVLMDSKRSELGGQPPEAVLFCGDTKGSIRCFAEFPDEGVDSAPRHSRSSPEEKTGGGNVFRAGMRVPILEMKHQHGKDQVSRLALLGDCLLSAGHDGFVNHYLITYRRVAGVRKPCSFPRHEPKPTSTGGAPESRRSARARARKPVHVPETAVGVTLTLVTCYPAAPVTAIADMWVGGGWWRGEGDGDSPLRCGEQDRIRIVVAGRSGSARMSAWDLVEGRQLLELECGDKHLAQDLFLSWASTQEGPLLRSDGSLPCLQTADCSSVHRGVPDPRRAGCRVGVESRGGSDSDGGSFNRPRAVTTSHSPSGEARGVAECHLDHDAMLSSAREPSSPSASYSWASIRPAFARLPRHTAVFATPGSTDPKVTLTSASRTEETKEHAHRALESRGDPKAAMGSHGFERPEKAPSILAGVRLAFNSSIVRGDMGAGPEQYRRGTALGIPDGGARGCTKGRGNCKIPDSQDRGPGAGVRTTCDGSSAQSWHAGATADRDSTFSQFSYSLSEPFHGQRVATVRFLRGEMSGAPAIRGEYGRQADARLITGGEDGLMKLLDVFCDEHDRRCAGESEFAGSMGDDQDNRVSRVSTSVSRTRGARTSSGDASLGADDVDDVEGGEACVFPTPKGVSLPFCLPRLKVEQTLPPHESSIVSLAIASPLTWPSSQERGATDGGSSRADLSEQCLAFSGGGKMELRAWSLNASRAKPLPREVEAAAPIVRWLLTTTPAPKSACHAHRIMCLCTLPVPPRPPIRRPIGHLDSGEDDGGGGGTVLVAAGDSGGGLSLFAAQNYGRRDGEDGECRARLIGRWVLASGRPVLCVAHAGVEVESSFSPSSSASETEGLEAQSSGEGASCSRSTTPANTKQAARRKGEDRVSDFRMAGVRESNGRVERASHDCDLVRDIAETREASLPPENDAARQESCAPVVLGKGTRPRPGPSWDDEGCVGHQDLQATQGCLQQSKTRGTVATPVGSGRYEGETELGPAVQDVIITGDTAGKVTLWRVVRDDDVASQDHASGSSPGASENSGRDETVNNRSGASMSWPFVNRGPEGRRRGTAHAGPGQDTRVPRLGLIPVLEYNAHQMGVLSVAVNACHRKGRVLIVTGGDDQAIGVAEIEISIENDGVVSASLVGGAPDLIKGVAGSAVKGVALLVSPQRASSPVGVGDVSGATRAVGHSASGLTSCRSHSVLSEMSVFSISRDRRLSRWDLRRTLARASSFNALSTYSDREASSRDVPTQEEGQPGRFRCKGREWELEWRAGCLTDVCDVSDMDVIALASGLEVDTNLTADDDDDDDDDYGGRVGSDEPDGGFPQGNEVLPPSAVTGLTSPRVLVAVSGQGLQVFEFAQWNPARNSKGVVGL